MSFAGRHRMDCARVDELASAAALEAVDEGDARAVDDHLATCDRPHAELRELLGAGAVVASTVEPVTPDAALRARVMASVANSPQGAPSPEPEPLSADRRPRRRWFEWLSPGLSRGLVGVAGVAVGALLVWNVGLQQQLATRDAALAAVADVLRGGQPAYAVSGSAGSGYVVDTEGPGATFLAAGLEQLPAGHIYELWLIDADGAALPAGAIDDVDPGLTVAVVEDDLGDYAAFAVTVEEERVAAPTQDPVMVGSISN